MFGRTKYGGIDKYVLTTKSDLLGWEGMRLRVLVRERQTTNTPGAEPPVAQVST